MISGPTPRHMGGTYNHDCSTRRAAAQGYLKACSSAAAQSNTKTSTSETLQQLNVKRTVRRLSILPAMSSPPSTEPGPSTAAPSPPAPQQPPNPPNPSNPEQVSEVLRQALTTMVATKPGVFRDLLQPAAQQQLTAGGNGASEFYGVRVCVFWVRILVNLRAFRRRSESKV